MASHLYSTTRIPDDETRPPQVGGLFAAQAPRKAGRDPSEHPWRGGACGRVSPKGPPRLRPARATRPPPPDPASRPRRLTSSVEAAQNMEVALPKPSTATQDLQTHPG